MRGQGRAKGEKRERGEGYRQTSEEGGKREMGEGRGDRQRGREGRMREGEEGRGDSQKGREGERGKMRGRTAGEKRMRSTC